MRLLVLVSTFTLVTRAVAQVPNYCESRLTASNAGVADHFGRAVAVDGDTLVIGAPEADVVGADSGMVYVYTRNGLGWTEQQLQSSDIAGANDFGWSLALEGDTLVVGAPEASSSGTPNAGAAYVFVKSGGAWVQQQKLEAGTPVSYGDCGYSVAIDGGTLVVGSPGSTSGAGSPHAFVFTRSGAVWTQQAELIASNGEPYSYFGASVALDGDTAVIGSPNFQSFRGRAYVFERAGATWSEEQILSAANPTETTYYGASVAVDGDTAMVAVPVYGVVDVLVRSGTTWNLEQQIHPALIQGDDSFGTVGIALVGDTAVIGAPYRDTHDPNSGATFGFVRSGTLWSQAFVLQGSQTVGEDHAGTAAFDGATIVVGAPGAGHTGIGDAGEAYVFTLTSGVDTYCVGKINSQGCTPSMNACGAPSASSSSGFVITCFKVLDGTNGLLFYGYASTAAPFQGGTLCVQPPTRRTPVQLAQNVASSGNCRSAFTLDFNAWIASGADPLLVPGANVYAQWWMRDPASASTTGLSNGVSFSVGP